MRHTTTPFSLIFFFFFSSRRRHTRFKCDWSSDVCSSDLNAVIVRVERPGGVIAQHGAEGIDERLPEAGPVAARPGRQRDFQPDRARTDGSRLHPKPIVELLFPLLALLGPGHPGRELRGGLSRGW